MRDKCERNRDEERGLFQEGRGEEALEGRGGGGGCLERAERKWREGSSSSAPGAEML